MSSTVGPVADVSEHRSDVTGISDHEVAALAAYGDDSRIVAILCNELPRGPVDVGVEPSGQATIRRDQDDLYPIDIATREQGMDVVLILVGLRGQVSEEAVEIVGIRSAGQCGVLRTPHLGRGDHRHRVRYLRGVLDASYSAS